MIETPGLPENISCEEFQNRMAELIASGADASQHPHIQSCELCRDLLAQLEVIAQVARELFPEVDPPDHVWERLESAIREEDAASSK